MLFVNRVDELAALRAWWDRPNARPALVWGRRRVGKTALLQHFAASTEAPVVFHTGTGETAAAEIATLSRQVAAAVPDGMRDLAAAPYESWRDLQTGAKPDGAKQANAKTKHPGATSQPPASPLALDQPPG